MINWVNIKHFSEKEFNVDFNLVNPKLIYTLDTFRELYGKRIYPSPVDGAIARTYGSRSSRHYAIGRKSDAIDLFMEGDIREMFILPLLSKLWGGVGIYFDTFYKDRPWPMVHLDLRSGNLTTYWYRKKGEYYYPKSDFNARKDLFELIGAI